MKTKEPNKFVSRCVLHDSTPRVWRRLTDLGLRANVFGNLTPRTYDNKMCVVASLGTFYTANEANILNGLFDCGKDLTLFLAVAAMREDTDIHQWFVYDDRYKHRDGSGRHFWFRCSVDSVVDDLDPSLDFEACVKATPLELKLYFNGYDD